jgi:hypothetical protein
MTDNHREKGGNISPEQLFGSFYDRVQDVAEKYAGKSIERSGSNLEEMMYISLGAESIVLQFTTRNLNIAFPDTPEGAYENTFTFSIERDSMLLTYIEALPRRQQSIGVRALEFKSAEELRKRMIPFVEKINLLLTYFQITDQVEIPF